MLKLIEVVDGQKDLSKPEYLEKIMINMNNVSAIEEKDGAFIFIMNNDDSYVISKTHNETQWSILTAMIKNAVIK